MRDSSQWSRVRASLLVACGAVIVLSRAAHAQSAVPIDQKQPWFNACMDAITAKVRAKQVHAQKVEWLVDTVTQRERSSTETAVNGKGQFLGQKGNWNQFNFHCVYNTRQGKVTEATWRRPDQGQ